MNLTADAAVKATEPDATETQRRGGDKAFVVRQQRILGPKVFEAHFDPAANDRLVAKDHLSRDGAAGTIATDRGDKPIVLHGGIDDDGCKRGERESDAGLNLFHATIEALIERNASKGLTLLIVDAQTRRAAVDLRKRRQFVADARRSLGLEPARAGVDLVVRAFARVVDCARDRRPKRLRFKSKRPRNARVTERSLAYCM